MSGDSAALASGGGTHSDRSMRLAGSLMVETSNAIITQARRVAAALLDVAEGDIAFSDGLFAASNRNRRLGVFEIARAMVDNPSLPDELRTPLKAQASFTGRIPAYPTGAAVCEVEVDPETGAVEIRRYTSIDDAGQAVNPLILHGQVHGGAVQGMGQALMEGIVHEPGSGEMLSGELSRLRNAARRPVSAVSCRVDGRSDQGQQAAHQGRRRERDHAEPGGALECGDGRAVGYRH